MSYMWRVFLLGLCLPALAAQPDPTAFSTVPEIVNLDQIAKILKVNRFHGKRLKPKMKIAIFDNGFYGFEKKVANGDLPKDTLHPSTGKTEIESDYHGTVQAMLVNGLLKRAGVKGEYKLALYYTKGYDRLESAINDMIKDDSAIKIIVYSQAWEYNGDGDTDGPINRLVDRATQPGMLWINSSGDLGSFVRIQKFKDEGTGWVKFTSPKGKPESGAKIICHAVEKAKYCNARITVTWNATNPSIDRGTTKDLDIYLYDAKGKQVGASEWIQVDKFPADTRNLYLDMPREEITMPSIDKNKKLIPPMHPGTYTLKVKIKSKNFDERDGVKNQLRISLTPQSFPNGDIELVEPTMDENLLAPADNPNVIVVGAADDALHSNRSLSRGIPLVNYPGFIQLKNGERWLGSSQSAALGGALAFLDVGTGKASYEKLDVSNKLATLSLELAQEYSQKPTSSGRPPLQRPQPQNSSQNNCVMSIQLPREEIYPELARLLHTGRAAVTSYHGRMVIAYQGDFGAENGLYGSDFRVLPDGTISRKIVYVTPGGTGSFYPEELEQMGYSGSAFEIMNTPVPPCY